MPINLGAYLGLGKESAYGTPVAPAVYAALTKPAKLTVNVPLADVANVNTYGPLATVPGIRWADFSAEATVTPNFLGAALSALMGSPSSTGTAPNFVHTFTPKLVVPSFTAEHDDGVDTFRTQGVKISELAFTHSPEGFLKLVVTGMGQDRVGGAAYVAPTLESEFFFQRHLTITLNAVALSADVEDFSLNLKMGKEALKGFGSQTISLVEIDGTAEATAQFTLRFSSARDAARYADYTAATARAASFDWLLNANREFKVDFANCVLSADPLVISNDALGLARVSIQLRALSSGGSLFTATLKNGQAGTAY
jgi:hypothetical protein